MFSALYDTTLWPEHLVLLIIMITLCSNFHQIDIRNSCETRVFSTININFCLSDNEMFGIL